MKNIIKFTQNRVWRTYQGGKLLDDIAGISPSKDSSFPEDWIGSTVAAKNVGREHIQEGLAVVKNAQGETVPFKEILLKHQDFYLGQINGQLRPLDDIPLVKFLDSATRLHFQAHPTREFAQQRLDSNRGKTEAYVILAIREEVTKPYIYAGFQRPPTRAELKLWIETQNIAAIEGCFDKIPVKPGDVFLLPGGRPHALGEGILMLEIMEPSDWAVRFEFERCGYVIPEAARFMGRDIETALDVFNFDAVTQENIDAEFRCVPKVLHKDGQGNLLEELIGADNTDCFRVRRARLTSSFARRERDFFYGIVVAGSGSITFDGQLIALKQWETFFLPAEVIDFCYQSTEGLTIIECYPAERSSHE